MKKRELTPGHEVDVVRLRRLQPYSRKIGMRPFGRTRRALSREEGLISDTESSDKKKPVSDLPFLPAGLTIRNRYLPQAFITFSSGMVDH